MKPVVALVGRPNVGKSALFNRIAQRRLSIVEDIPGVTRDRVYADAEWAGTDFVVIDTGGFEVHSKDLSAQVREQAEAAIREADAVVFVVDGKDGLTAADWDIAQIIRSGDMPSLLAVNKSDTNRAQDNVNEFYELGLGEPYLVSAVHGNGVGDLLDAILEKLPAGSTEEDVPDEGESIRLAIVGRPNVGKSSLVNALTGSSRMIVSDIPGTTRDAIDVQWNAAGHSFLLIDTAGLRRKGKIEEQLERTSAARSLKAVDRSDVALILLDPTEGVLEQDKRIAGYAHREGKGSVLLVNKADLVTSNPKAIEKFTQEIRTKINFLSYAPVIYISAKTGDSLDKIPDTVAKVYRACSKSIKTADLNRVMQDAVRVSPPPSQRGKQLKVFYGTQIKVKPPTFLFFVNNADLISDSYQRYLEDRLRAAFDLEGTPIRFHWRSRERE
jgi:GTPase